MDGLQRKILLKWMMTGGTPISGNSHIGLSCVCSLKPIEKFEKNSTDLNGKYMDLGINQLYEGIFYPVVSMILFLILDACKWIHFFSEEFPFIYT